MPNNRFESNGAPYHALQGRPPLKRAFYEIECIRGDWSVRALKRQIATLYFKRSELSTDKEKLAAMAQAGTESAEPKLSIRDSYVFEFLGLKAREPVAESDFCYRLRYQVPHGPRRGGRGRLTDAA